MGSELYKKEKVSWIEVFATLWLVMLYPTWPVFKPCHFDTAVLMDSALTLWAHTGPPSSVFCQLIGIHLNSYGLGRFSNQDTKNTNIKTNNKKVTSWNWNYVQYRKPSLEWKGDLKMGKNITIYITERWLVSRIYKENTQKAKHQENQ